MVDGRQTVDRQETGDRQETVDRQETYRRQAGDRQETGNTILTYHDRFLYDLDRKKTEDVLVFQFLHQVSLLQEGLGVHGAGFEGLHCDLCLALQETPVYHTERSMACINTVIGSPTAIPPFQSNLVV